MRRELSDAALAVFAIFCRFGSCLMLVPGYSSARLPMQVRLLLVIAVSLALAPLLFDQVMKALLGVAQNMRLVLVAKEIAVGSIIGLMARYYLLGLQFAGIFAANAIGLAGIPGQPLDDSEALPALSSLLSLGGVVVLLAAGMHGEILMALTESYTALPMNLSFDEASFLEKLLKTATDSSVMALQLSGPFVVYAVVVNVAMGLANKFAPQVSLYFASLGIVTMGGLFLFHVMAADWLGAFRDNYAAWLSGGRG